LRLLRPAYGLVESGRLWQLAIEKWIFARDFVVVPGAPQVFVLRQSGTLKMLIVKVVDDFLVCGPPDEIQAFYKDLSRTYKLNPLRTGLLWAAKDETSLDIMGRMFCCNFLRKSRL
jgi:hypothetical protein